jgi:hypothetical protein
MPEGDGPEGGEYEFDVAPEIGSSLMLKLDGKSRFYEVEDAFHGFSERRGRVIYYAVLVSIERSGKWLDPDDYGPAPLHRR